MAEELNKTCAISHDCIYNVNTESPVETSEVDDLQNAEDGKLCGNHKRHRRGKKRKNHGSVCLDDAVVSSRSIETAGYKSRSTWRRKNRRRSKLVIRPTVVPKAPENSTQFIIDNHETSSLFQSFEKGNFSPKWADLYGHEDLWNYSNELMTSSPHDELFWDSYLQRNFEEMYRSAREEELASLTNEQLVQKIELLECKVKELEEKLHMRDPETLILKLQQELLRLQEDQKLMEQINADLLSQKNCSLA